eukprot:844106-Rhodomonas_salina.1
MAEPLSVFLSILSTLPHFLPFHPFFPIPSPTPPLPSSLSLSLSLPTLPTPLCLPPSPLPLSPDPGSAAQVSFSAAHRRLRQSGVRYPPTRLLRDARSGCTVWRYVPMCCTVLICRGAPLSAYGICLGARCAMPSTDAAYDYTRPCTAFVCTGMTR